MSTLSTPSAIVLGSAIFGLSIGASIYFGLRARAPQVATPTPTAIAAPPSAPGESTLPGSAPAGTLQGPAKAALASGVLKDALAEIDRARPDLVKQCWVPVDAGSAHSSFQLHIVVDANGDQLGRSFLDGVGARQGVAQCLSHTMARVHVSPPGQRVTVDVPFDLP